MLEVHPPHQAPHTWKDFFIHITTITIGLLIAISLEQTVEYIHHRHQVAEMLARLHDDNVNNHDVVLSDLAETDRVMHEVQLDIAVLEAIRADGDRAAYAPAPLPVWVGYVPSDTAWLMMRDNALLPLVPTRLAQNYWKVEVTLAALDRRKWDADRSRGQLEALLRVHAKPGRLTAQQRETLELAFAGYQEDLTRYRRNLRDFDIINSMAIANQPITVRAARQLGFGGP